jgi:hypothetical protein
VFRDITGEVNADGGAGLSEKRAREWSLVLSARGVAHRLFREGESWRVGVPARLAEQAVNEIRAYVRENAPGEAEAPRLERPVPVRAVAWIMAEWGCASRF